MYFKVLAGNSLLTEHSFEIHLCDTWVAVINPTTLSLLLSVSHVHPSCPSTFTFISTLRWALGCDAVINPHAANRTLLTSVHPPLECLIVGGRVDKNIIILGLFCHQSCPKYWKRHNGPRDWVPGYWVENTMVLAIVGMPFQKRLLSLSWELVFQKLFLGKETGGQSWAVAGLNFKSHDWVE